MLLLYCPLRCQRIHNDLLGCPTPPLFPHLLNACDRAYASVSVPLAIRVGRPMAATASNPDSANNQPLVAVPAKSVNQPLVAHPTGAWCSTIQRRSILQIESPGMIHLLRPPRDATDIKWCILIALQQCGWVSTMVATFGCRRRCLILSHSPGGVT